jgi:tight adherence protein C
VTPRLAVASGLGLWAGTALVLAATAPVSLAERLRGRPGPAGPGAPSTLAVMSQAAARLGGRLAGLLGVDEDAAVRLARVHSPLSVAEFRLRQAGWSLGAFAAGALACVALGPPGVAGLLLVPGAGLLGFLVVERGLARQSERWQRRLFLELPVVAEQLAMLLSAGYSLTSAMARVASRGQGACARDLAGVVERTRQGVDELEALREWAELAQVRAVDRVVAVLSLSRETPDLGRLLSAEARSIRQEVHRSLVEEMERRGQKVWVPVTVAALVPGAVFLMVPFVEALRLFSGG